MKIILRINIPLVIGFLLVTGALAAPIQQADDPNPPAQPVKLIFIHHSTGENWLRDDYGGLGLALGQNNYFVSDTNYGWGPDGIGDRTDIPNWLEWFRGGNTDTIMAAVFNENEQHSEYTRSLADPGGENQIVMFKSCFPNSALSGNPDDPATPGIDLTVGNAKYVYNEILQYFATRPDKLFIVITAPPLIDKEYSANARAFNQWLVNDWLRENNYTQANVAVFDFYNVLTGPDNHHRYQNGAIEHLVSPGRDNAFYPSEDDHPNPSGSQKATQEFLPLLNIFYHRWQATAPVQAQAPQGSVAPPVAVSSEAAVVPAVKLPAGRLDDFEGGAPSGSQGWQAFWDEATQTKMSCNPQAGQGVDGSGGLVVDYSVAVGSWATCALFFEKPQDWSRYQGVAFQVKPGQDGQVLEMILYAGGDENRESYLLSRAGLATANTWALVQADWDQFHRASWEDNPDSPFQKTGQVTGFAIGLPESTSGKVSFDNLQLVSGAIRPGGDQEEPGNAPVEPAEPAGEGKGVSLPCMGGLLPLVLVGVVWVKTKTWL